MDKETAFEIFYKLNQINPESIADPLDAHYDLRLAVLPQKVNQQLHRRFPEWFAKQKIFCGSIAPRRRGIQHIDKNCKKHGISLVWLYDQEWIQQPTFERSSQDYLQLEMYEKCVGEPLTIPNNTLSTFWRIGVDMEPPFYRDGNQPSRLSLMDLKQRKQLIFLACYSSWSAH